MKLPAYVVRAGAWAAVAAAVGGGMGGCKEPAVDRAAELQRFQTEIHKRADSLEIKPGAILSMGECEEIALQNNLNLAVSRLALRLQDDQVRLAMAGALPHANAVYDNSRRGNSAAVAFGGQELSMADQTQQNFTIGATVPVLDYGMTYYAWQIAKDQRTQQRLLLVRAGQELRRDVRIAYAKHAGALRQVKLSQINVLAAERVLKVGETMERESLATHADVAVLRAALAQTQVDLTVEQRRVEETRLGLMQLLSLPPDRVIGIDDKLPELPLPPTDEALAGLEDHALMVRPELQVQDLQRHISAYNVKREVAAFFPRIDANGSFNWGSNSFSANPAFFMYGFQIANSLLDGTSQIWRYGLADKTRTVEEERTLLLSLGVIYDVNLRALQMQRDRETIRALEVTEDARKKAFDEIVSLYKEGFETEAGTAKALAELNIQSLGVDKAQTDYLVTWFEFEDATLAEMPAPATTTAPTTPNTHPTAPSVATQPIAGTGLEKGNVK